MNERKHIYNFGLWYLISVDIFQKIFSINKKSAFYECQTCTLIYFVGFSMFFMKLNNYEHIKSTHCPIGADLYCAKGRSDGQNGHTKRYHMFCLTLVVVHRNLLIQLVLMSTSINPYEFYMLKCSHGLAWAWFFRYLLTNVYITDSWHDYLMSMRARIHTFATCTQDFNGELHLQVKDGHCSISLVLPFLL